MSLGLFKNVIYKICLEIIYLIYMYKKDLALNYVQRLISHKTKSNQLILLQLSIYFHPQYSVLMQKRRDVK